jgi:hypothetical protein
MAIDKGNSFDFKLPQNRLDRLQVNQQMIGDLSACLNKKYSSTITKDNQIHLNMVLKKFIDQVTLNLPNFGN